MGEGEHSNEIDAHLTQLISGILSHEISNALTYVLGHLEALFGGLRELATEAADPRSRSQRGPSSLELLELAELAEQASAGSIRIARVVRSLRALVATPHQEPCRVLLADVVVLLQDLMPSLSSFASVEQSASPGATVVGPVHQVMILLIELISVGLATAARQAAPRGPLGIAFRSGEHGGVLVELACGQPLIGTAPPDLERANTLARCLAANVRAYRSDQGLSD